MSVIRELAVKLGLDVDAQAWAKGEIAVELLKAGLNKVVEAAGEVVEKINQVAEGAEGIVSLSQSAGVSTDALQRMGKAAALEGVSVDTLAHNLILLNRNMHAVTPGAKSADEAFEQLVRRFSEMPDGVEKTNLALKAFGRGGAEMIKVLNGGEEALEAMRTAVVMTPEQLEAGKQVVTVQRQISAQTQALWKGAIAPLLPAIRDLLKQYLAWKKANADTTKSNLRQWVGYAITAIKALGSAFAVAVDLISRTANVLKNYWQPALIAATAALAPFIVSMAAAGIAMLGTAAGAVVAAAPFIALAAAIGGVVALLDDVDTYKAVEKWNKLHPDKQLDPKKFSLLGRYKAAIDSWTEVHTEDPWWLKAIKTAVVYLEKALGIVDDLGWNDGPKSKDLGGGNRGYVDPSGKKVFTSGPAADATAQDVTYSLPARIDHWLDGGSFSAHPTPVPSTGGVGTVYAPQTKVEFHLYGTPEENRAAIGVELDRRGVIGTAELEHAAGGLPATQ